MRSKLLFGWDITLLLVIVAFIYVCFDKVCAVVAIIAVAKSGQAGVDVNTMIKELVGMNGDFAKTMISLVGTFFTIVLAGSLFKAQQEDNSNSNSTSQKPSVTETVKPTVAVVPSPPVQPVKAAPSVEKPKEKEVTVTELPD